MTLNDDKARISNNSHVIVLEQLIKFYFPAKNDVLVLDPP